MDLRIHMGLDDFTMIDSVSAVDEKRIEGLANLDSIPVSMGIEAVAQLGALHARFLTAFAKHCFLLVIECLDVAQVTSPIGTLHLHAALETRTQRAFSYAVKASARGRELLSGRFIVGAVDYDERFRQECLECHYRKIFQCLTQGLPNDFR
jgi:hypothetical protein